MFFPPIQRPRPLLFDLGDTLVNFSATNPVPFIKQGTRVAYDFMDRRGVSLPSFKRYHRACQCVVYSTFLAAHLRRRELDLMGSLRRLHRWLELPLGEEFLLQVAERFYEPMRRLGTLEEGLQPVLQALQQGGHPLAIVSNTMVPGPILDGHLDELGLLKYFPVRIYSCDIGVRKPHPDIFLAALRALNIRPQGALFLGDKVKIDIKGAGRMGMTTVLKVRVGATPRSRYTAHHVIKHLTELPQLLRRIGPLYQDSAPLLALEELPAHYRARSYRPPGPRPRAAVEHTT